MLTALRNELSHLTQPPEIEEMASGAWRKGCRSVQGTVRRVEGDCGRTAIR